MVEDCKKIHLVSYILECQICWPTPTPTDWSLFCFQCVFLHCLVSAGHLSPLTAQFPGPNHPNIWAKYVSLVLRPQLTLLTPHAPPGFSQMAVKHYLQYCVISVKLCQFVTNLWEHLLWFTQQKYNVTTSLVSEPHYSSKIRHKDFHPSFVRS